MGRPRSRVFTEGEQRVLQALCALKSATVSELRAYLAEESDVAYTTVLTMVGVLCTKGYAERRRKGRAHVYRPLVSEAALRGQALTTLLGRFFGGSPEALARHLISEKDLKPDALAALRKEIVRSLGRKENPR
jgi:predicted transcriptional regulator